MKRVQKINIMKMIALTRESDIINTLITHKNIIEIKKFKKLMMFKIIFEESRRILKLNDF